MAEVYNKGGIVHGSRVLSINATNYIADNINVNRALNEISSNDETGSPNREAGVTGRVTGDAQLQLASSTTPEPRAGDTFTVTFDTTIGSETFILTNVSRPEASGAETKINIDFIKDPTV